MPRRTSSELLTENRRLRARLRELEHRQALAAAVCLLLGSDWSAVPAWARWMLLELARALEM